MSEKEMLIEFLEAEIEYMDVDPDETIRLSIPHAKLALKELKSSHSLRLAVCEYFNNNSPELSNAIMLGAPFPNEARGGINLALSAGIEFKNGTWILKEGE